MATSRWERLLEELAGLAQVGSDAADQVKEAPPPPLPSDSHTTLGFLMWMTFGFFVIAQGMLEGVREKIDDEAGPGWQKYYRMKQGAGSVLVVMILGIIGPLIPIAWLLFFRDNFWTMVPGRPPIGIVPAVIFCLIALAVLRILFGYASGLGLPQSAEGQRALPGSPAKRMWRRVFAWLAFALLAMATGLIAYGYWCDNY